MEEIFIQTEEQRAILESVRRFVEDEVTPRAAELDAAADQDPTAGYSTDIVEAADRLGLRTMTLSEELGGMGVDSLTTAMVVEEMERDHDQLGVIQIAFVVVDLILLDLLPARQDAQVCDLLVCWVKVNRGQ